MQCVFTLSKDFQCDSTLKILCTITVFVCGLLSSVFGPFLVQFYRAGFVKVFFGNRKTWGVSLISQGLSSRYYFLSLTYPTLQLNYISPDSICNLRYRKSFLNQNFPLLEMISKFGSKFFNILLLLFQVLQFHLKSCTASQLQISHVKNGFSKISCLCSENWGHLFII